MRTLLPLLVAYGLTSGCQPSPTASPSDAAVEDATSPNDAGTTPVSDAAPPASDAALDPSQTPPTSGRAALEAWLSEGHYLAWHCETAEHAARPPGAHGATRICSNDLLHDATGATFPAGAASVKELYDSVGGSLIGYAVAVKEDAESAGGTGWYWYERSRTSVYADGPGVAICTGCHGTADTSFAPTSRDYVFTVAP